MVSKDAADAVADLLEEAGDRIAKTWAQIAYSAAGDRVAITRRDLARPLGGYLDDLARLLRQHGAEAADIFGAAMRHHGGERFEQQYAASDVVREMRALEEALLEEWRRRRGDAPLDVTLFVADLTTAATAAALDDYVRRVRASRAHLREEAAVESIVSHLVEGLVAVEADGTVSFVTPPAETILGCPASELVGVRARDADQLIRRLELRDEDDAQLRGEDLPYLEVLRTGRRSRTRWLRIRRPSDREDRIVETDAIPLYENGELRGAVETFRDRTQEYRQREALSRAYDELRRMHLSVLRRTRTEILGEVSGSVAGMLNNALNAIRLRCELAADRGVSRGVLTPIVESVDHVAGLIGRLQELAADRPPGPLGPVPLDDVVREACELVQPEITAAASGRALRFELELNAPHPVRARRPDLREVVVHALLRALDTAPPGSRVALRTDVEGSEALLTIRDHGDPNAPPIFLPAVAEFEGRVVSRRAETGTHELLITLPLWQQEVVASRVNGTIPATQSEGVHATRSARTVLIVDDDNDNREMLAAVLEGHGIRAIQAEGASAADQAIRQGPPVDVALVDLAMPDRSGAEYVRSLHTAHPSMRIALVTGYEPTPGLRGVEAVFRKPVDIGRLLEFLGHAPGGPKELSP